jgi:hypothetical protein
MFPFSEKKKGRIFSVCRKIATFALGIAKVRQKNPIISCMDIKLPM